MFINITGVNPIVGVSCAFISMSASFIPTPFFLILLAISSLSVGPQGLIPIYATAMTSYLFCIGIGVPQGLVHLSKRNNIESENSSVRQEGIAPDAAV